MGAIHGEPERQVTNFVQASFIDGAQGHKHTLHIISFHGKNIWTAKEEHRLAIQL